MSERNYWRYLGRIKYFNKARIISLSFWSRGISWCIEDTCLIKDLATGSKGYFISFFKSLNAWNSRETIWYSPKEHSLSDLFYNTTKALADGLWKQIKTLLISYMQERKIQCLKRSLWLAKNVLNNRISGKKKFKILLQANACQCCCRVVCPVFFSLRRDKYWQLIWPSGVQSGL